MMRTPEIVVRRVQLRAQRAAVYMGRLWAEGATSPDQGLAVTAGEVSRLLESAEARAAAERTFQDSDPTAAALAEPIREADLGLANDPCWRRLVLAFALSDAEADFLCLLLAATYDDGLARVFAYLHDDAGRTLPTPWLAGRLFQQPEVHALLYWRLAQPVDGDAARQGAAWRVDPAVAMSLKAGVWEDPDLLGCVSIAPADFPCLQPAALDRLLALTAAPRLWLVGTEGSGRQTLAAQYAARLGKPLLVVDTPKALAAGPAAADQVVAVARMARHQGAIAYWRDGGLVPSGVWDRAGGVQMLRGCRHPGLGGEVIQLEPLSIAQRRIAWARHSGAPPPAMIASQRLTPAEIAICARRASDRPEAVRAALRHAAPVRSDLLTLLPCPYGWDDLILHADLKLQLQAFETQVRLRWSVMEDWGFGAAHPFKGVSALFGGPSGAGKTMAAQVLARSLELDLYRVDLAGVIDKYIGETEKRLREVFDVCERSGALLFFDEADALFGSRTQVKDSHDRFANIEINYLLQRIEQFDGVAILATNRKNDIDQAFLRRLRFVIEFLTPRPEERLALWRRALPEATPAGEPLLDAIDFPMLADQLQMTGADIKGAALSAAYLAREEGGRIGMRHVLAAAEREMAKHGTRPRVPWREPAE